MAKEQQRARLVFGDGNVFSGRVFAQGSDCSGEVIFNTAMTGYQEVLTDPSYNGQLVVLTYPMAGNYGINPDDVQSAQLHLKALLVKEYIDYPSNWRSTESLRQYLERAGKLGVEGIDTRRLTRYLRDKGAQNAILTTSDVSTETLLAQAKAIPHIDGQNLAKEVSLKAPKTVANTGAKFKVAVLDCGAKQGIVDQLVAVGCACTVYPYNVTADEILDGGYDGLMLSNGPGDPEPVTDAIALIRACLGKVPIFGICLGHQLLSHALGCRIIKLKFGHHGINHPVQDLGTQKVEITSQNHIYCVEADSVPDGISVTHVNLNDKTVAGIAHPGHQAFSVQYHPEAAPGPRDSHYLFQRFATLMATGRLAGFDDA